MGWITATILGVVGVVVAVLAYFLWAGPSIDIQFTVPGWIIVAVVFAFAVGLAVKFAP